MLRPQAASVRSRPGEQLSGIDSQDAWAPALHPGSAPPFSGTAPPRKPSFCSDHAGLWDEGHQGDLGSGETTAGAWPCGREPPTSLQAAEAFE